MPSLLIVSKAQFPLSCETEIDPEGPQSFGFTVSMIHQSATFRKINAAFFRPDPCSLRPL